MAEDELDPGFNPFTYHEYIHRRIDLSITGRRFDNMLQEAKIIAASFLNVPLDDLYIVSNSTLQVVATRRFTSTVGDEMQVPSLVSMNVTVGVKTDADHLPANGPEEPPGTSAPVSTE